MRKTEVGLACVLAVLARGDSLQVQVDDTTATQAILAYTAPDNNPCSVAVSQFNSLSPLLNDVNPALFAGADSDQRPGNVVSGTSRTVVIGKRTAERALDGNLYSRALQAFTQHYFTVTCGASVGSGTFTTKNPPLGNSAPDSVPFLLGAWGNQGWPSMTWQDQSAQYIDPLTGLLIKRITGPGQSSAGEGPFALSYIADLASAWNNSTNIIGSGGYASTAAKGQANALFIQLPANFYGGNNYSAELLYDDIKSLVSGYTDTSGDTISICLTYNHGQSCIGSTVGLTLPVGSGSAAQVTAPVSPGFPSPLFAGWGSPKIAVDQIANVTGTVKVSGSTVTLASTPYFPLSLVAGDHIIIAGSSPACPNNDCTITALVNASTLTISQTLTLSGAAFTLPNFGVMIWNSGSTGTVYLQNAQALGAYSAPFSVGDDGTANFCSVQTVTINYEADGTTPLVPAETGRICQFLDVSGNPTLFLFIPQTGESRLIAYGDSAYGNGTAGTFDPSNPDIVYYSQNNAANPIIHQCTYSGNYAALPPNYTGAPSPNYSCTSITSGTGNDLISQVGKVVPGFNSIYFSRVVLSGSLYGNYIGVEAMAGNQGSIAYSCIFDVTQAPGSQIIGCHDTWSTYPERWGGAHGGFGMRNSEWGNIFLVPLLSAGATGTGQYQMTINSISGQSGITALTGNVSSDPTTQSCSALGVTDPRWIALGATGNNCIQMVVATEPQNLTPSATDVTQLPSACNTGYAQLQSIQPGDYVADLSQTGGDEVNGEQFLVAGKTGSGCSPIALVLARGVNQGCASAPQSHSNGWTPVMIPTQNCSGNNYWVSAADTTTAYADNSATYLGHSFTGLPSSTANAMASFTSNNGAFGYGSYGVRQGTLPSLIGQPFQYGVNMTYPFSGSGTPLKGPQVGINYVQSHPGGQSYQATPGTLGYDGRPLGGGGGGIGTVWYHTLTLVSGQSNTYQISCAQAGSTGGNCIDSLDRKRLGMVAFAGRFMLADISGPGSTISDSTPYTYCIADFVGECVAGSSAGNRYVSVPNATTAGACVVGGLDQNTPCLATVQAATGQATQFNWGASDPNALNWRRLGYALGGPGQTNNYWNVHGIVDGTWALTEVDWKEGVRKDIVAIQLPPWPGPPADGINRSDFVHLLIPIQGEAGDSVRIRFGYDSNLYCTSRLEQCTTAGAAPFTWLSEARNAGGTPATGSTHSPGPPRSAFGLSCPATCEVDIPALSGRILYYVVDHSNGGRINSSTMQVVAVP